MITFYGLVMFGCVMVMPIKELDESTLVFKVWLTIKRHLFGRLCHFALSGQFREK
jgi:hypothetical protein